MPLGYTLSGTSTTVPTKEIWIDEFKEKGQRAEIKEGNKQSKYSNPR